MDNMIIDSSFEIEKHILFHQYYEWLNRKNQQTLVRKGNTLDVHTTLGASDRYGQFLIVIVLLFFCYFTTALRQRLILSFLCKNK